jgi:hydroxyacylglutathione hydrolase
VKRLAEDVWQISSVMPDAINAYLVGDVLVDAATRHSARRILRQLRGHAVSAHALTHAHADHQGASHELCATLGVPFWVGARDADAAEDPRLIRERSSNHPLPRLYYRIWAGPGHPVDRRLAEGDDVAGFTVIDTPGHSRGHIALWRESDRTLIAGDVLSSIDTVTGLPGLHDSKPFFTADVAQNHRSARRLAALEPALVLFGHGRPVRDTKKFVDFVAALPA